METKTEINLADALTLSLSIAKLSRASFLSTLASMALLEALQQPGKAIATKDYCFGYSQSNLAEYGESLVYDLGLTLHVRISISTGYFEVHGMDPAGDEEIAGAIIRLQTKLRPSAAPVVKPMHKTGPLPEYVDKIAFCAAMSTVVETFREFPATQLPRLEVALFFYALKLKDYKGLGKDALESAKNAVVQEMRDIPADVLKMALGAYFRVSVL